MSEGIPAAPSFEPGQRTEALSHALQALGFERSTHLNRMTWTGRYDGRDTTLTIGRQSRTSHAGDVSTRKHLGFRLGIEMATTVPTRFYLVVAGFADSGIMRRLYRWKRQLVLDKLPAPLSEFRGVAKEEAWGRSLLADARTVEELAGLLEEKTERGLKGSVYFEPLWLNYGSGILSGADLDPAWVTSILERMGRIAATAEALPPPKITQKIGRLGKLTRNNPAAFMVVVIAAFAGVGLVISLVIILGLLAFALVFN